MKAEIRTGGPIAAIQDSRPVSGHSGCGDRKDASGLGLRAADALDIRHLVTDSRRVRRPFSDVAVACAELRRWT